MITNIYKGIDEKVQKLLQRSSALAQPVNIDRVVEYLKLSVRKTPLEDEYSGFLAVKEKTIVINSRHVPVRQRFTIAHEVGHYQLHRNTGDKAPVFIDRTVYFRKIGADGTTVALHFPIHSTKAEKSFQPDIACAKWSATPASLS